MIISVSIVTNCSARMLKEIVMPRSSVMILANSFCAVSDRRLSTPHSRRRLPNIKKPTRETDIGATKPAMMVTIMGNRMRVRLEIAFALTCGIRMRRSFFVVIALMTTG